jgi:exodeoxyribonuclease VII small subunit
MAVKTSEPSTTGASGASEASGAAEADVADAPAFEQTLCELEALVARLESGDLPLDAALRTFEQGVRLTRECQNSLEHAQQKVQRLLQRGDSVVIEDLDAAGSAELAASE